MNTHLEILRDHEPHVLSIDDALIVAKWPGVSRFVWSDLGWVEIKRNDLIKTLRYGGMDSVKVQKVQHFTTYHFSKP